MLKEWEHHSLNRKRDGVWEAGKNQSLSKGEVLSCVEMNGLVKNLS